MNNKNFEVYFDCGSSKIRAGAFNKNDPKHSIYKESNFFLDHSTIELEIQKVISSLETDTNEYLDNVNLMIDSPDLLSISICLSKKFDGSKLKKEDIKFLIQDAKQQVLKNYFNQSILTKSFFYSHQRIVKFKSHLSSSYQLVTTNPSPKSTLRNIFVSNRIFTEQRVMMFR